MCGKHFHFNIYKSDWYIFCKKNVLAHVHDQFEVVVNFGYGGAVGEQQHSSSSRAIIFIWLGLSTTPSMIMMWKLLLLLPGTALSLQLEDGNQLG